MMRQKLPSILQLTAFSLVYWSVVMCLFLLLRYMDLEGEPGITFKEDFEISIRDLSLYGITLGILIGIPYAIIEVIFDQILRPKISLGLSILIRTLSYLIMLIFSITFVMVIAEIQLGLNLPNEPGWWRSSSLFWVFVAYFGVFSIIFSFLKIGKERFGRGTFFGILLGRYTQPREEDRIFMFLDLRSSTSIAEKLGHLSYSAFIRDCFLDLNAILNKYDADIYQYVGDEAVLSWKNNKGVASNNCIALFFDFKRKLDSRTNYYQKQYGLLPEFKAGLHGGTLVVVEVGSVKKELAYHGDVINTTARIQDQCNQYGEDLLISEDLLRYLKIDNGYVPMEIGNLVLKGKTESLKLYAINETKKIPES